MGDSNHAVIDQDSFFRKLRRWARYIPFARDLAAMYFAMLDSETPMAARVQIAGAITYFILPTDLIPDAIVPVGYTDDAVVFAGCLSIVSTHVTKEHYRLADEIF